jgi:hypothetical protein
VCVLCVLCVNVHTRQTSPAYTLRGRHSVEKELVTPGPSAFHACFSAFFAAVEGFAACGKRGVVRLEIEAGRHPLATQGWADMRAYCISSPVVGAYRPEDTVKSVATSSPGMCGDL